MTNRIEFPWPVDRRRLERADNYWLATTRPDGRAHVAPVWGSWHDGRLYFPTDPESVKGRNLRAHPGAVVHLDDSLDVLIVEGVVSPVDDAATIRQVDDALAAKYVLASGEPYRLTMHPANAVWVLAPRRALVWWDPGADQTRRRWVWSDGPDPSAG